jgi:hypothetical protein
VVAVVSAITLQNAPRPSLPRQAAKANGVGEDAEIKPAHHQAEQDADRDAAPRCFAEFPRFPFAHLRRRPRRNADVDHHSDEIEQDGEDGGSDRGDEQLTDGRLGEQRINDDRS